MADTRTVVLVLSPRAAEAVQRGLTNARWKVHEPTDPTVAEYADLLDQVIAELKTQQGTLPPLTAQAIGEQMANAAREAVAL
jgi:hypothetical protein